MSLKAKVEAIIYAAEEPITLEQISLLLKDVVLADLASTQENAAIEQADSAAEAAANAAEAGEGEASTTETSGEDGALLPELASENTGDVSPEPGPLMPQEDTPSADANSEEPELSDHPSPKEDLSAPLESKIEIPSDESTSESSLGQNSTSGTESTPALQDGPVEAADLETTATSQSTSEPVPAESASVNAPESTSRKRQPKKTEQEIAEEKTVRTRVREVLVELIGDYASEDRGMEIRQVAGGFRMATKPEHHDVVRAFAKSLKPPIRLSLAALETLAVVAYKQPITGPEIADIRGVESASVLGTLLDRKLITTAGRKQVIGRPMQYKTSKDFLMRFGLNDVNELPSMEEFSSLAFDSTVEITPTEAQETQSLFEPTAEGAKAGAEPGENAESITAPLVDNPESVSSDSQPQVAEEPHVEDQSDVQSDEQPKEAQHDIPEDESEPESPITEPTEVELTEVESSKDLEAQDEGSQIPESHPSDAAEAADSQPQSDAESCNVPEAEHPIGK